MKSDEGVSQRCPPDDSPPPKRCRY
jgi:hypothetical protein